MHRNRCRGVENGRQNGATRGAVVFRVSLSYPPFSCACLPVSAACIMFVPMRGWQRRRMKWNDEIVCFANTIWIEYSDERSGASF